MSYNYFLFLKILLTYIKIDDKLLIVTFTDGFTSDILLFKKHSWKLTKTKFFIIINFVALSI